MTADEVASHCPTCGAEYRPGFEVCADDGTRLVIGAAPQDPPEANSPPQAPVDPPVRWVAVASFAREEEARLLSGRLEAEGVPARIDPEGRAYYYGPGTSAMLGQPIRVLVPENRELETRLIVEELERT